jgi:predicted ArsR family transcriptional regulator
VPPRRDLRYRRKNVTGGLAHWSGDRLVDAVQFHHVRRGAEYDTNAEAMRVETVARSFGFAELQNLTTETTPTWLRLALPGGGKAGKRGFLTLLIAAHRQGALGIVASQPELATLLEVHKKTIQRWSDDLEAEGLVEVVQTWQAAPAKSGRRQGFWKLFYRPGPALAELGGLAILEGARELPKRVAELAKFHARRARRRLRTQRAEGRDRSWRAREAERAEAEATIVKNAQAKAHREAEARRKAVEHGDQLELGQPPQLRLELSSETVKAADELVRRMGGGHPSTLSVDNLSPPPPVRRGRVISQPVPDMVRPSASGEDPPPAEVPPVAFGDAPPVEPASNPPAATTDDLEAARHCTSRAIVDEPLERVEPPERARRKRSPPLHSGAECAGYPAPCDCIRCPSCGGGGATPGWDNCPTCGGGGSVPGGRL